VKKNSDEPATPEDPQAPGDRAEGPETPTDPQEGRGARGGNRPNPLVAVGRWDVKDVFVVWIGQAHLVHFDGGGGTLCGSTGFSVFDPNICWAAMSCPSQCTACHRVAFNHGVLWRSANDLLPARFVGSNRPLERNYRR